MDWLTRIAETCAEPLTDRLLRERLLVQLRSRIPYDAHVFALTDPATRVMTSPHADVPVLPRSRLPELIRWRYLTVVNRVDSLVGAPASSLLTATADPSTSLVWKHVQRDLGVVDTATVTFADRYGVWGYLELWRSTPFERGELDLLTLTQPVVAAGLRAAVARTFLEPAEPLLPIGPAVVVLGPDLAVHSQTEAASAALLQVLPPGEPVAPVPAAAYNVGAALLAVEEGVPVGEPWSRLHLGGSRWMTVKASRLGEDIAVSLEPASVAERADLFARCHGLSPRESEILTLLGTGRDSAEIAAALVLSDHTVNDHVKSVLAKTGARTRQVLLSRALGAGGMLP